MNSSDKTVFIVDDDEAVRDSLGLLMKSIGLRAETFALATDFLEVYSPQRFGCIILDIRMPGMSGLDLQKELNRIGSVLPIIFITGHGDVPMAVQAMREGAMDFIQKPFRDQDLIDRVHSALQLDSEKRERSEQHDQIRSNLQRLTGRETEILERIVNGQLNKVIAMELSLSQRTVEVHRARVMEKMSARSVADLVRMVTEIRSV